MKKKNLFIIIILVLVVYFGVKAFFLSIYSNDDINPITFTINDKKITIKHQVLPEDQYITVENVKFKNIFSDFKEIQNESSRYYILEHTSSDKVAGVSYSINEDTDVNILKSDQEDLFGIYTYDTEKSDFTSLDQKYRVAFLNKYKITNDLELLQFLEKNQNKENTIFTPIIKMKENYFIKLLIVTGISDYTYTIIDGDYTGYVISNIGDSKTKVVRLYKNDKLYVFVFVNLDLDYFTDEVIEDFISTVIIN